MPPYRKQVAKHQAAEKETDNEDEGIELAGDDRGRSRTGAEATHDHADTEQHATNRHRREIGRQQIDLADIYEPDQGQPPQAEHCRDDGAEHDDGDIDVLEIEHARDLAAVCKAAMMQGKAEYEADRHRQPQVHRVRYQTGLCQWCDHSHCFLTNQAAA